MLLPPAPSRLVAPDGTVEQTGLFTGVVGDANLVDCRLPYWGRLTSLRLKQWQHWCIIHPKGVLTLAVVDTGYLKVGWLQVLDRAHGDQYEHHRQSPFLDARVARSLHDDHTRLQSRGLSLQIHSHLDAGVHRLELEATRSRQAAPVKASLTAQATWEPMVIVMPLGRGRAMYSHKTCLPIEGVIEAGNQRWECDPSNTFALLDVHKATYPWYTWWHWSTFVGKTEDGRVIAANLTRNVANCDFPHENVAWVDGKLEVLSPSVMDTQRDPWSAKTLDNKTQLSFAAEAERAEKLNVGLIQSKFQQRAGTYTGTLGLESGDVAVNNWFGLFEDHLARW